MAIESLRRDMASIGYPDNGCQEQAKRERYIPRALNLLESAIDRLSKSGQELERRLQFVLMPDTPAVCGPPKDAPQDGVELARLLDSYRERVALIAERLESLADRVEL